MNKCAMCGQVKACAELYSGLVVPYCRVCARIKFGDNKVKPKLQKMEFKKPEYRKKIIT